MDIKCGEYAVDIINGMIDWVRVIDSDHRIVFMNYSMKEQAGDYVGRRCYEGLGLEEPCPNCITDETLRTGKIHAKEEKVMDRTFSVVSSPIRDKDGKVCSAVEVFRDITKEKMLEQSIKNQNRKLNNNLCFAKTLQNKMMPERGVVNGCILIDHAYMPCDILGGDLLDVLPIDDRNTAIYIFDISGHGVMSAMITMFVRQTVRALAERHFCPGAVLRGLLQKYNQLGLENESFVTIIYGVFNSESKIFTYANGGHNPPMLLQRGKAQFVEGADIPICSLAQDFEYKNHKLQLNSKDFLYLYTDGVTEARSQAGEFFGTKGLAQAVLQGNNANDIIKLLECFTQGKLSDDVAILSIKIL